MRGFSALTAVILLGGSLAGGCGAAGSANDNEDNDQCGRIVEDGGGVIPSPPDGASLCPAGACNYQSQTGCAAGMSCRAGVLPNSENIMSYCEAAGSGSDGETCTAATDCGIGYVCPSDRKCHRLCCGRDWSESACSPGYGCYREYRFTFANGDEVSTGAYVCDRIGCDVLTSDDCPSDSDCKIIDPRGNTACVPPTPGDAGDRCTGPIACGRGLSCIGDPGEETCRRLCSAEKCGKPACGPDEGTCVHFNWDPEGVGECTPGWPAP